VEKPTVLEGDYVLLSDEENKKWLVRATKGSVLQTHIGAIPLERLVGLRYGDVYETERGARVFILRPLPRDFVMKSGRKTQIIYPKDAGLLLVGLGISPGSRILEIGTGSGAMTTFLASAVGPSGVVYSYEIREEFAELAKKNLAKAGLLERVIIENRDAREGVDERDVDVAIVDIGDPWNVLDVIWNAIKGGGCVGIVVPTINQAERVVGLMERGGFVDVSCVELLLRNIEARVGRSRPSTRMVGHTAYLILGRKVNTKPPVGERCDESRNL